MYSFTAETGKVASIEDHTNLPATKLSHSDH